MRVPWVHERFHRKTSFYRHDNPLAPALPSSGAGHIAMSLNYRHGKYLHGSVQVIRHYRNRGYPGGGGGA
jgi:hypothetical protein